MNALEILRNEHGLIRQFVDTLSLAVGKLEEGKHPPRTFFELAAEFAREVADRSHHFKEEHLLFARLAAKKKGTIDGQIEMLRNQHDRARNYWAEIVKSLDGYAQKQPIQTSTVLESVAAYVAVLRQHMHLEDHVFYPLVEKTLSREELDAVLAEFEKHRKEAGTDAFEKHHKQVVDLGSMLVHMG